MSATAVACPKCGGQELYDNRAENAERVARGEKARPAFKCKDSACAGVIWGPKSSPAKASPVKVAQSFGTLPGDEEEAQELRQATTVDAFDEIASRHAKCLKHVVKHVVPWLEKEGITTDAQAVSALTAQLFIELNRRAA
jgi:hypothetical protein